MENMLELWNGSSEMNAGPHGDPFHLDRIQAHFKLPRETRLL